MFVKSVFNKAGIYFISNSPQSTPSNDNSIILINSSVGAPRGLITSGSDGYKFISINSELICNSGYSKYGDTNPSNLDKGSTSSRPTLTSDDIGYQYFDTTLKKPLFWDGTNWVDATGVTV